MEHLMFDSPHAKLLSACQLEIELAWNNAMDDSPVHRLAEAHPELAEELYAFFADVMEAEDYPEPKQARTFLALVRGAAGESVDEIATSMDVTPDFLVVVSKYGSLMPLATRKELVRRARVGREIEEEEALASFDVSAAHRRAASRDRAYPETDESYADLVTQSNLNSAQKLFWLDLG
jgi:hypothetical protein